MDFTGYRFVSELLPTPTADNGQARPRTNRYGDQYTNIMNGSRHNLVKAGMYHLFTNPTPSTAIAYGSAGTQATFSDTAAFMVVKNNNALSDPAPKDLCLDYLRLLVNGTVPASATSTQFAIKIDNVSRVPSANFSLLAPVNARLRSTAGQPKLWVPSAGVPTVPASGESARLVSRGTLRSVISVTLDEYVMRFGGIDGAGAASASGAGRYPSDAPPVVLGPQEYAVIHLWQPGGATNPLSFEFELGCWEDRPQQ